MVCVCVCVVGTGMQIPPAAQQALQMSGAIAIGAMAAVSGTRLSVRQVSDDSLFEPCRDGVISGYTFEYTYCSANCTPPQHAPTADLSFEPTSPGSTSSAAEYFIREPLQMVWHVGKT